MKKLIFLLSLTLISACGSKSHEDRFVELCTKDKSSNADEAKMCPCLAASLEKNLKPEVYEDMLQIMENKHTNAGIDPKIATNRDMMAGLFRAGLACDTN